MKRKIYLIPFESYSKVLSRRREKLLLFLLLGFVDLTSKFHRYILVAGLNCLHCFDCALF